MPSLPTALVSALKVEDVVLGKDDRRYVVTSVGPGALVLEGECGTVRIFTNCGYAPYSWAYYAAPSLRWLC